MLKFVLDLFQNIFFLDFANEQCEQALLQKPQKLDNVTKQFYLNLKATGK